MARRNEWSPLFEAVHRAGWKVRPAKHGFLALPTDPTLPPIAIGGTPSDHRCVRNVTARLRRAGLDI